MPLEEEHDGRNEGLSLRPKGAAALLHRKGESRPSPSTQHDSNDRWGAHALRPKGAEALLHQKGEPRPTLNRQGYSRRGLTHWMEGSHATEGSQRLCCTGGKSPVRHRARSATRNDGWRRHTATEGSRGSAAPEGEHRPTLNKQRDATDGGTLTASEGSCGSAAPEGRVPLAA